MTAHKSARAKGTLAAVEKVIRVEIRPPVHDLEPLQEGDLRRAPFLFTDIKFITFHGWCNGGSGLQAVVVSILKPTTTLLTVSLAAGRQGSQHGRVHNQRVRIEALAGTRLGLHTSSQGGC